MTEMKQRLQSDLTESIRSRDEVRSATLRMALSAITNEEVSGKQARILTDDEVITVLGREAKKRRESVEAYTAANRPELADRESAELAVLANYLPEALSEEELAGLIAAAVDAARAQGLEGMKAMGVVMKQLQPQITGRADGAAVAAAVKAALGA
ncbi:MAG: GatB/YqeY domain-containing protein [Actinomycetes bacterium]